MPSFAGHVRRYLDSLELLSLTMEKVAAHASQKDLRRQRKTFLIRLDQLYEHPLIPRTLPDFITEQIKHDALRSLGFWLGILASADASPNW